ncbi:MAG: dynamin family protein [Bacteroidaceae bacterium]|nr:dynamin family protein [Bacteroidaceae bacterium]
MDILKDFNQRIQKADELVTSVLPTGEVLNDLSLKKDEASKTLERNKEVKIPFIGDFSAGKSSLLNAFMGVDLLPTNLTPETAVSYQLYYDTREHLVIVRGDGSTEEAPVDAIKSLKLTPNDMVNVYVNNDKIRELNARGIVLVDMPGIDSGIEAHNNAITKYLQEGTIFVIVADAEQGTLRNSAISFIREIKQYSLSAAVLINKADKKSQSDMQQNILPHITDQAKRYIGEGTFVGVTSASTKETGAVSIILNDVDVESAIKQRCSGAVNGYINDDITAVQTRITIINTGKDEYAEKLEQLKNGRDKALRKLKELDENAQPVADSAQDILDDVSNALNARSSSLANLLFSSNNNMNMFNAELLNIIRPVMLNAFKRELTEYSTVIGGAVQGFAVDVNDILADKNNKPLDYAKEMAGNMFGGKALENMLNAGMKKLMERWAEKKGLVTLLGCLSKVIGPVATIIVNLIPDILSFIFGKSREEKVEEIRAKLSSGVFDRIVEGLRPQVVQMLAEQRTNAMSEAEKLVNEEIKNFDAAIEQAQNEQEKNAQEREVETGKLVQTVQELQALLIA